jgi:hypothetical protein
MIFGNYINKAVLNILEIIWNSREALDRHFCSISLFLFIHCYDWHICLGPDFASARRLFMTVRGLANLTKNTQLFESIQKYQRWKEMTYTNYLQTPKIHVCILISTWKSKVDNTLSEGITNINIYHILSHARILRKQIFHYWSQIKISQQSCKGRKDKSIEMARAPDGKSSSHSDHWITAPLFIRGGHM